MDNETSLKRIDRFGKAASELDSLASLYPAYYHRSSLMSIYNLTTGLTLVANRLYAVPYPIERRRTPVTIAIQVRTADAVNSNLRIGIYNDNGNAYPSTRLTNGGVVSVATNGLKTVAYTIPLEKGLYWIVIVADGTPEISHATNNFRSIVGYATNLTIGMGGWFRNNAYGSLPDPFGAGGSQVTSMLGVGFSFT